MTTTIKQTQQSFRKIKPLSLLLTLLIAGCSGSSGSSDETETVVESGSTTTETTTENSNGVFNVSGTGAHTITLAGMSFEQTETATVTIADVTALSLPNLVDLNDISISGQTLINNTPMEISSLYLESSDGIHLVSLTPSLSAYSQGQLEQQWSGARIINDITLANSTFEYTSSDFPSDFPNARHADAEERNTGELLQIYDRYMLNDPATLSEVTEHLRVICSNNTECQDYNESVENFAADTYYAKSVSGINSRLWIDTDVWGLANQPSLNFSSSESNNKYLNIWMNPELVAQVNQTRRLAIDGWQGFVHELYHNYGLSHDSGWASNNGIDDIFGQKVVDTYLAEIENNLIVPDLVINEVTELDNSQYRITLTQTSTENELTARILSSAYISAQIEQESTSSITVTFNDAPLTDVYLSFYNQDSKQMASTVLQFSLNLNTQGQLDYFNDDISFWLNRYDVVNVNTRDGVWINDFYLPSSDVEVGKVVNFNSRATFSSIIHYNSSQDTLTTGNQRSYRFDGTAWQRITQ